jgi:gamma-glutamyltranspeptidase / glutathione hydrolase
MAKAANEVPPGTPASAAAEATFPGGFPKTASAQSLDRTSADTMYLTVADDEGTMVSLIQSNFQGFGSGLVAGGFGLQDRGSLFNMAEGSANQYMPGKRPFHTIIPGFATTKDAQGSWQPWLSFGVMGGNIQPQGQAQILANIIDFGMNPQEAGDAARYDHEGDNSPTGDVMHDGGRVQLEGGVCAAVEEELQRRGHHTSRGANGGGYQAIMYDHVQRSYIGATEMRKDGIAAGY